MLELIDEHVGRGESFAFETTLASKTFAKSIVRWRVRGYTVVLHFLSLPTAERALDRVARRVRQGGHAIEAGVVRRRFVAGVQNFEQIYKALVDHWLLLDNSGPEPISIESGAATLNAPTTSNPEHQKRIEDVIAALRRAKRDAEDLAIATGTELVEADSEESPAALPNCKRD